MESSPGPRYGHAMATQGSRIFIFDGKSSDSTNKSLKMALFVLDTGLLESYIRILFYPNRERHLDRINYLDMTNSVVL